MNKRIRKKKNKQLATKLIATAVSKLKPGQHMVAVMHGTDRKTITVMIVKGRATRTCRPCEESFLYSDNCRYVIDCEPRLDLSGDIIAEGIVTADAFNS